MSQHNPKKIWLISDEHYNHEKMLQYQNRPFTDTKEYQHHMREWHNEMVQPDDHVFHLGDYMFTDNWKQLAQLLRKFNGIHHLIIGNHDRLYIWDYVEAGFMSVHTSMKLGELWLVHDPAPAGVFKDVNWVHGHLHSAGLNIAKNTYNVSVEMHDYRPVNFAKIVDYFKDNEQKM